MGDKQVTSSLDAWRRHALFVISVAMMGAGLMMGTDSSSTEFARAICLKVGIVLFMIWLAMPQLRKLNPWAVVPVAAVSLIAIVRPQLILVLARIIVPLAPILFLIWLLRMPKKKRVR